MKLNFDFDATVTEFLAMENHDLLAVVPASQAIYLLRDDGSQHGPFGATQVERQLANGEATPQTFAWHEGLSEGRPLSAIIQVPLSPPLSPRTPLPPSAPAVLTASASVETTMRLPPVAPDSTPSTPPQPRQSWYKRRGWQIVLFIFFPFIQVPLMWYWRLFTRPTRIKVTVAGCIWILVALAMPSPTEALRKEFAENRTALLTQIKAADQTHDYQRVISLDDRYSFVHDPELDNFLYTARAALKAAQEKDGANRKNAEEDEKVEREQAEAIEDALRRPDPARSQIYQNSWPAGYSFGKEKREAGEHPVGQYVQASALEAGQQLYPLSPQDQMDFTYGYTDGFRAGYATDAERKAQAEKIAAQRREETARRRVAERERNEAAAAAEEKARQDAAAEEKAMREASIPVTDWSGMTKVQWVQKATKVFRWSRRQPLIAPADQFQRIMGKPNRTQTVSNYVFWYYECADGTVQLEADASALQTGTIRAQVSDD